MTYAETLEFLFGRLPMFQRSGPAAYKPDLGNTIKLCSILGDPHIGLKCIHIAGTNGKGSTSHFLAAILQQAGYKTGLFTSPHLKDFRERIRIDGNMISENEVIDFVTEYHDRFMVVGLSFFEMTAGLAFHHFKQNKTDIAIIETGLGGRLDSTNVVSPVLSIITNIGFDHISLLGNTLEQIAFEKAGIIKQNTPVIIGEKNINSTKVFIEKAKEKNAKIIWAEESVSLSQINYADNSNYILKFNALIAGVESIENIESGLSGSYQISNVRTVLTTISELKKLELNIPESAIQDGFRDVVKLTGLRGRWEKIGTCPTTICDAAHNEHGITQLLKQVSMMKFRQLRIVFGTVSDKDILPILELLPKEAIYYFCNADILRSMKAKELKSKGNEVGLKGLSYPSVEKALLAARMESQKGDMVLVTGSIFVVGEALENVPDQFP